MGDGFQRLNRTPVCGWVGMLILIHTLLTYLLPLAVGFVSGMALRPIIRGWALKVLAGFATVLASFLVQYTAFLVFSGYMTGNWPTTITPGELLGGLAWFAIPAAFSCLPLTVGGYVCGCVLPFSGARGLPSDSAAS